MTTTPRLFHTLVAIALFSALPAAGAATRGQLLPATDGDLVPASLSAAKQAPDPTLETQPVDFAWAIPADSVLAAPEPFQAESREFWSLQTAAELQHGFAFEVGSAGALIRVSPADASKAAIDLASLELSLEGRPLAAGAGILRSAAADELKALGADFGDGTRVLQLDPAFGSGRVVLNLPKAAGRHLIHVLEPASEQVLTLAADRAIALAGGRIEFTAAWQAGGAPLAADRIAGVVTAPDGRSFDLQFAADSAGGYTAALDLPAEVAALPGLWEVHGFAAAAVDGRQLLRDAKSSFAVAAPSARLAGDFVADADGGGLQLAIGVETAAAGRYELRGTLHGTTADGKLVPFAVAHAARMLDAGAGQIVLKIGRELINGAAVRAPFEVRDLSLEDQGQMSRQESRALALRVAAVDTAPRPGARGASRD